MKLYFICIITALTNLLVILLYLGVSAGFANYIPIISTVGCILLFIATPPLLLYKYRIGIISGLCFAIFILPTSTMLAFDGVSKSGSNPITYIFYLPSLINLFVVYYFAQILLKKGNYIFSGNQSLKVVLAIGPLILFILYIITIAKNFRYVGN